VAAVSAALSSESQAIRPFGFRSGQALPLQFTATRLVAVAQGADQNVGQSAGLQIDCGLLETWIRLGSNNGSRVFCQKQ
jgi:hypothetical protein